MKRLAIILVLSFLYPVLAFSQDNQEEQIVVDSLAVSQTDAVMVTLDNDTGNKLENIEHFAKPYSIKELFQFPDGLDSVNLSFWIAVIALLFGVFTFWAQRQTEKHTKNVPIKDQREKFRDLSRHEYRNLCCALAAAMKFFDKANGFEKNRKGYPSESNLQKLKVQPEDIVLSIDSDVAALISEMRLLLRNYNIEIDVASQHLAKKNISDVSIHQDFDNILFKPMYLLKRAYDLEIALVNRGTRRSKRIDKNTLLDRTMLTILNEHLSKIGSSLPRYAKDGIYSYLLKLKTVEGYRYPFVDYTNAIERSLNFLLQDDNKHVLRTTLKLTDNIKKSISKVKESINTIHDEYPEVYSHIVNYEDMLDSMLNKKEVDFMSIFPTMLAIDAIAETANIGMVNYE